MKIFITGGTGFIGRNTLELLTRTSHQLKVLVRKCSDTSFLKKTNVVCIEGDLLSKGSLIDGMKDCDSVINIAGIYSFWEPNDKIFREVNVNGTKNVMLAALETGVKKVIHVSTAGIYGKPTDEPFTEESALGPKQYSKYYQTKFEGERICWDIRDCR